MSTTETFSNNWIWYDIHNIFYKKNYTSWHKSYSSSAKGACFTIITIIITSTSHLCSTTTTFPKTITECVKSWLALSSHVVSLQRSYFSSSWCRHSRHRRVTLYHCCSNDWSGAEEVLFEEHHVRADIVFITDTNDEYLIGITVAAPSASSYVCSWSHNSDD